MARQFYCRTASMKVRMTDQQSSFLRVTGMQLGINPSELLRRLLDDAIRKWTDEGLYTPDVATPTETSIDFTRGVNGNLRILFPEGLSPEAQQRVQKALQPYVPELKALITAKGRNGG
jgi:hypothetical protein